MMARWLLSLVFLVTGGLPAAPQTPNRIDLRKPAGPPPAQPAPVADAEMQRSLAEERRQYEEALAKSAGADRRATSLEAEQAELRMQLVRSAADIRDHERQIAAGEAALAGLRQREAEARARLALKRTTIAQMLAQMQRMGREPPPVMVTERSDALKMIRSGMVLASFLPEFRGAAQALAEELAEVDRIIAAARATQEKLAAGKLDLDKLRADLKTMLAAKEQQMTGERAEAARLKAAAEKHGKAIGDLSGMLAKLDLEVASQTQLAAYEADLKRGKAVELTPGAAEPVEPARLRPALAFGAAKGRLALPAEGVRKARFGAPDGNGGKSEGIRIETGGEAQVTAPCDGWIIYAGPFRSYGQLLIINAGGGYHILLAGMEAISAAEGQFVVAGEPVGTMSPGGGGASSGKPSLYVEFRKDARPVDPDPWWTPGTGKG